jgi:hypothetical protein
MDASADQNFMAINVQWTRSRQSGRKCVKRMKLDEGKTERSTLTCMTPGLNIRVLDSSELPEYDAQLPCFDLRAEIANTDGSIHCHRVSRIVSVTQLNWLIHAGLHGYLRNY